jgi:hypothetical protein
MLVFEPRPLEYREIEWVFLHPTGDTVHHRHRFDWIASRRSLGGQHDGVCSFVDRGCHIGRLRPGRCRRRNHRFEHLRRHHNGLSRDSAGVDHLLLYARHILGRHLDAKVAARDH